MLPDKRHPLPRPTRRRVGRASLQPFLEHWREPFTWCGAGIVVGDLCAVGSAKVAASAPTVRQHGAASLFADPQLATPPAAASELLAPLAFLLPFNRQAFPGSITQLGDVCRYLHIGNDRCDRFRFSGDAWSGSPDQSK
ncbi:uncharacterized protein LOC100275633 [Zea mays]|uniref:Sister chromatid cohesion 1 protein 4 n=3 Tax=Zea mays TaxID=4577 RepID=B6SWW3_MAIZE|nr:uncharacterized protein LOC100275633 [Zea mays]ACG29346.1 hypothetical protein [Zea mays]ACG29379.1 hypothetical protein [Zea mays]|eukprot:NP_001143152.1 uncharacterized protein LOC100275633 [Zea mays]